MHKVILVSLMGLALAGCSRHTNPLLTEPVNVVAKWLYQNELTAMEKLRFYDSDSSIYLACVNDSQRFDNPMRQQSGQQRCQRFFTELVQLAKNSKHFTRLTVDDLNNQAVAKRIGVALNRLVMSEGQS